MPTWTNKIEFEKEVREHAYLQFLKGVEGVRPLEERRLMLPIRENNLAALRVYTCEMKGVALILRKEEAGKLLTSEPRGTPRLASFLMLRGRTFESCWRLLGSQCDYSTIFARISKPR